MASTDENTPERPPYDGMGSNEPAWWPSRYGADDLRGASNEITPKRTLDALSIPRLGEIIDLALPLHSGVATVPPRKWHQVVLAHGATAKHIESLESRETYLEEHVSGGYHIGCHIDALGHLGIDGTFYNGHRFEHFYDPEGISLLDITTAGPWVTRGVCLDLQSSVGEDKLEGGFAISAKMLEEAASKQGVEVRAGDAVLINTNWSRLWDSDPDRYGESEPGLGWDSAHWLTDKRISLVGVDNWGLEVVPAETPGRDFIVHQHLLAETGTHIIENIDTSRLAAGRHNEFLFVAAVPKVLGATAGQVNPLAIV